MRDHLFSNHVAAEERYLENDAEQTQIDMAALYDATAKKWTRDEPKVRDDLISWPLLVDLLKRYGTGKAILDCGCGSGNICRLASPFAKSVVGIDISKQMIEEAEKHTPAPSNVVYVLGDMMKLSRFLPPHSIDLCISIFGFCCIPSVDALKHTLAEMRKVVKPGGATIIQIPHPLDGFFKQDSAWFHDLETPKSYFDSGTPVRRELKTPEGDWLLVARHHFTIGNYFESLLAAGFHITQVIEPRPSEEVVKQHPSLAREALLPSSMIIVANA